MKHQKKLLFILVICLVIASCKTTKNKFLNRNYHVLTTKFNVLFNGKDHFNAGIKKINESYEDDFWKQLPVEPLKFEETKSLKSVTFRGGIGGGFDDPVDTSESEKELTSFERAEEKAVKAIQKHSMNIGEKERNSQVDEAYLLLGKSRYYSQRFIPAIEALNYIVVNYPKASLIYETKIWRAKANIRNGNEEFAIETLKLIVDILDGKEGVSKRVTEEAYTALAMAYASTDSIQKFKDHLKLATITQKNKEQTARNMFILGQVYSQENQKDSAIMVFDKLTEFRDAPQKYKINAAIEIAKNSPENHSSPELIKRIEKLIKNRDNRLYLDKLLHQLGVLHQRNDSLDLAIKFYNKSLKAKKGSDTQKTYTYESLGNLYFDTSEYQLAGNYYDSVLTIATKKKELRIRRIERKYKNLETLIKFENTLTKNDSVLSIVKLSEEDQKAYFEKYISVIKKQDEERAQQELNAENFGGNQGGLQSSRKGGWYFYNPQSLSFGKSAFKKVWGNRKLTDGWRWLIIVSGSEESVAENDEKNTETAKNPKYEVETYLESLPKEADISKLEADRNTALYELGVTYKEQFVNIPLAIKRLERALKLNKKKELILPINWHLYKIYEALNDEKYRIYEAVILNEFPDSKFAQVIKNPGKVIEEEGPETSETEELYKEIYTFYKDDNFEDTVLLIDEILKTLSNSKLIPKFELLKAYAIGKHKDKKEYKAALEYVTVSYGNTEEGKRAKEIIKQLK